MIKFFNLWNNIIFLIIKKYAAILLRVLYLKNKYTEDLNEIIH